MNDAVLAVVSAIITGIFAVIASVVNSNKVSRDMGHKLEMHQAVTDTKIEELTREVREHNNFARRMPVVEEQIGELKGSVNLLKGYHME